MPVTKAEIDVAQEVTNLLVGDKAEAEAYADDPEGWLDSHGYGDVSPEALAICGTGGGSGGSGGGGGGAAGGGAAGGGAGASGYAYAAPPPVDAGAVAQLDYIVYNSYSTDTSGENSITSNIENHGNLEFNEQVGDGNVDIGDVNDSNLDTGEDDQLVDESTNVDAAVSLDAIRSIQRVQHLSAEAAVDDATNTSDGGDGDSDDGDGDALAPGPTAIPTTSDPGGDFVDP